MKTTINRTLEGVFQGAFILGLSTLLFLNEPAFSQKRDSLYPGLNIEKKDSVSGKFKASIFPSLDPLKLKVVFINPAKELVTLNIRKDGQKIIYTKVIGRVQSYNSKIDVSGLPDGNYTLKIDGAADSYLQNFQISTQIARLTYVQ